MEYADLIVVLVIVAFVAVCAAYVRWCERLVSDDAAPADEQPHETTSAVS
jgi:hypothetical protein